MKIEADKIVSRHNFWGGLWVNFCVVSDMMQNNPKAEVTLGSWGTLLIGGIEPETEGDWGWFLYDTPWTLGFKWSKSRSQLNQETEVYHNGPELQIRHVF